MRAEVRALGSRMDALGSRIDAQDVKITAIGTRLDLLVDRRVPLAVAGG